MTADYVGAGTVFCRRAMHGRPFHSSPQPTDWPGTIPFGTAIPKLGQWQITLISPQTSELSSATGFTPVVYGLLH